MAGFLKTAVKELVQLGPGWLCRREFREQAFERFNERPVEYGFVFRQIARLYPRSILDVGTGTTALPHLMRTCGALVTAIDNIRDYWPAGMHNRHYHVLDDDITRPRLAEQFDMVTCISVLEHIERSSDAVRNMFRLLKPGGHLVLTCPYTETGYVRNVYELPGSSYGQDFAFITQSYSRAELDRWLGESGAAIVEQEYWQFWEGEHWTVGTQLIPPRPAGRGERHQHTCLLLRKPG